MDVVFLLRAQRLLAERRPARLDHRLLVAMLAARQSASAAARAQLRASSEPLRPDGDEPVIELVLAGPEWRKAASAQQGCFDRTEAKRRFHGP